MKTFSSGESRPIIIIAAARSGTKMLQAALSVAPGIASFPYEIDYTWKYGNYHIDHDELTREHVTEDIQNFIRTQFSKLLKKSDAKRVLEKTVANSLRVDFVRAVFPECLIVHLFRDGRDVAASAKLYGQSQGPKEDVLKKLAEVPIKAWPYLFHEVRGFASLYANRLLFKKDHLKSWGPRFIGIDEAFQKYSIIEVCGIQWARCVELSLAQLSSLKENEDYINLRYEDLVQNPVHELKRVAEFLKIENFDPIKDYAETRIKDSYIGSWRTRLSEEEKEKLLPVIDRYLKALGYVD